jgi:hypothetical protein
MKTLRLTIIVACLLAAGNLGAQQPAPAAEKSAVLITVPSQQPLHLSITELKALPHITVTFHNSHTNADEIYSGVRIADLLAKLGGPFGGRATRKGASQLRNCDRFRHSGEVIVADAMDGKALDAHNGPFKVVVTEDKRPARSVRNLISIELRLAQ